MWCVEWILELNAFLSFTASSLKQKMDVALHALGQANEAFEQFENSLPIDMIALKPQWEAEENVAVTERGEKLKIFDVQFSKC